MFLWLYVCRISPPSVNSRYCLATFSHAFWALELLTDYGRRIWSLTEENVGSLGIQEVIIQGKPTNKYWVPVVSQVLFQVLGEHLKQSC